MNGSDLDIVAMILLYLGLLFASIFKLNSTLPHLAPGIRLTMAAGEENAAFQKIELHITRVSFSERR